MTGFCANPETATVLSVLTTGASTYVAVQAAIKEARANGGSSVGYAGDINRLEAINQKLGETVDRYRYVEGR
jgi:hypothetical protein